MHTRTAPLLLLALLVLAPVSATSATKESFLYLQVKQTKLRSGPQFWSQSIGDLSYGAPLVALGAAPTDKSWIKVKSGATEGYVHVSALTSRKVILSNTGGSKQAQVDSSDVVLAGKGFNDQVENSFGSTKGINFAVVDEVEKYQVDHAEEAIFLKEGKLN